MEIAIRGKEGRKAEEIGGISDLYAVRVSSKRVKTALPSKFQRKVGSFFSLDLFPPFPNSRELFLLTVGLINVRPLLFVAWQSLESASSICHGCFPCSG